MFGSEESYNYLEMLTSFSVGQVISKGLLPSEISLRRRRAYSCFDWRLDGGAFSTWSHSSA
jgi:hypothetical protein